MLMRKMYVQVATVACALSFIVATGTMAETAKVEKKEAQTTAVAVKHLKPQTTCPVMGGDIDKSQFVDYNGKRIYVCCGGCIAQVKADPEAAIKKLASLGQEPETIAPAKTVKIEQKKAAVKESTPKSMDHSSM